MAIFRQGREYASSIGKEQRVADVEENEAASCHESILTKSMHGRRGLSEGCLPRGRGEPYPKKM
jgi:hypothetical protein